MCNAKIMPWVVIMAVIAVATPRTLPYASPVTT
jgi:hypothetical protein